MEGLEIQKMTTNQEIADVKALRTSFRIEVHHEHTLQQDLNEIDDLFGPGKTSEMLIAYYLGKPVGCLGYIAQKQQPKFCQLRKWYVLTEFRSKSIGTVLFQTVLSKVKTHFKGARLNTLAIAKAALRIVDKYGFKQVDKYGECELPNAIFFEKCFDNPECP